MSEEIDPDEEITPSSQVGSKRRMGRPASPFGPSVGKSPDSPKAFGGTASSKGVGLRAFARAHTESKRALDLSKTAISHIETIFETFARDEPDGQVVGQADLALCAKALGLEHAWTTRGTVMAARKAGHTTRNVLTVKKNPAQDAQKKDLAELDLQLLPFKELIIELLQFNEKEDGGEQVLEEAPHLVTLVNKLQWTTDILRTFKQIFGLLGGDSEKAMISEKEMRTAARAIGIDPDDEAVDQATKVADNDGNHGIDFLEFLVWIGALAPPNHDFTREPQFLTLARDKNWTHENIADYKAVFQIFDSDGSETISINELLTVLRSLGHQPGKDDVREIIEEVDVDGSGELDFIEFLIVIATKMEDLDEPDDADDGVGEMWEEGKRPAKFKVVNIVQGMKWTAPQILEFKQAFKRFDADGDETISVNELAYLFKNLNMEVDTNELEQMIATVDKDGNGSIDFVEFLQLLAEGSMVNAEGPDGVKVADRRRSQLLMAASAAADDSETHEYELRQLLISIDGLEAWMRVDREQTEQLKKVCDGQGNRRRSSVRGSLASAVDMFENKNDKADCATKLLDCIKRVVATNQRTRMGEQIQDLILDMCKPRPPPPAEPGKPWRRALERWVRFCRIRSDVSRHLPDIPGQLLLQRMKETGAEDPNAELKPVLGCPKKENKPLSSGESRVASKVNASTGKYAAAVADRMSAMPHRLSNDPVGYQELRATSEFLRDCTRTEQASGAAAVQMPPDPPPPPQQKQQRRWRYPPGCQDDGLEMGRAWRYPRGLKTQDAYNVDENETQFQLLNFRPTTAPQYHDRKPPHDQPAFPLQKEIELYTTTQLQRRNAAKRNQLSTPAHGFEASLLADELSYMSKSLDGMGCVPEWRKALAEKVQLEASREQRRLPKKTPEVELDIDDNGVFSGEVEAVKLNDNLLDDAEITAAVRALDVLMAPGQEVSAGDVTIVRKLDASGNRFGTDGLSKLFTKMKLEKLMSLDLSRNVDLCKPHSQTAELLAQAMHKNQLRQLRVLKLECLRLPGSESWELLAEALPDCTYLEALSLADSHLGRASGESQNDCVAVATGVGKMSALKTLDLSGNFFRHAGCQALGAALSASTCLEVISVACNAGGFSGPGGDAQFYSRLKVWDMDCKDVPKLSENDTGKGGYPPLQDLLEAVPNNNTLTTLDLTSCQLAYEEAFLIELAALAHPCLETLLIADNPLGEEGVICIVRLIVKAPPGKIGWVDLTDTRKSQPHGHPFDTDDISGMYDLNLSWPHQRSLLWRLLMWCDTNDVQLPDIFSQGQHYERKDKSGPSKAVTNWPDFLKPASPTAASNDPKSKAKQMKRWAIPQTGLLHFRCLAGTDLWGPGDDAHKVVLNWMHSRRAKVTLQNFVTLSLLWRQLKMDDQREMLAEALARTCILKLVQIKYFLRNAPSSMSAFISETLYPCLENPERLALLDLVPGKAQQQAVMREARHLYYFNPGNPSARYQLSFTSRTDIAVLERVLVLNLWQKFMCVKIHLKDTTEYGNGNHLRNVSLNRQPFKFSENWITPPFGAGVLIGFDYVCPLRPDIDEPPTKDRIFTEFTRILKSSLARWYDKCVAVRCLSHCLVLSPSQLKRLVEVFPTDDKTLHSSDLLLAASEGWDEPRVEMFVIGYARCADRPTLMSPEVLYNPAVMPRTQCRKLWYRLGRLNTFDVLHLCQVVPSNLGNKYELQLTSYEGHTMMVILLKCVAHETEAHMAKCWYSEVSYLSHQGKNGEWTINYDYIIPATWLTHVPDSQRGAGGEAWAGFQNGGSIKFEWQSKDPAYVNEGFRRRMGEEFLNWSNQSGILAKKNYKRYARGKTRPLDEGDEIYFTGGGENI